MEPKLIEGGLAVDGRGVVRFVNDFHFEGVKRFYVLENFQAGYVRAWHGHLKETKWITVMKGSAVIGVRRIRKDGYFFEGSMPMRFIMTDRKPNVLFIPPGYANGCMALEAGTQVIHFSDMTLEDAKDDQFRLNAYSDDVTWRIDPR